MQPGKLSRRRFLRVAGAAALASVGVKPVLARPVPQQGDIDFNDETNSYNEIYDYPPLLGRVHPGNRVSIWKGPGPSYGRVRNVYGGLGPTGSYIAPIYRSVRGERYDARFWSDVWFETLGGYMHSAHLLPCHEIFNEAVEASGEGFWGEITVPESFQHKKPSLSSPKWDYDHYKCFYGQVHRVIERDQDGEGRFWYLLQDDIEPQRQAWVQAKHVRYVPPEELAPISPEVMNKRIEIDLGAQMITCFEEGLPVFKTRIASGTSLTDPSGNEIDFSTPYGDYHVQRKRPSRRMRGGESFGLPYDVNGVPWVTYFTYTGAAIHGAYWHNNFGLPRSHGCINVTADAAKWMFRWSQPYLGYHDDYYWVQPTDLATPVTIT